ncbi:beta-ketoacyl synthase N-terminal-like domain-containing protein [Streptomyces sp. NPDC056796]|uniref:beta-ketoacyl synthase N-terminal-like domain-containing protein n=1 Tax=Streptomyces sp. NPDC056796 TaxID=3345947 RepID=UPI0036C460FF
MTSLSAREAPVVPLTASPERPPAPVEPVDIVRCAVFSSAGYGLAPLADALAGGAVGARDTAAPAPPGDWPPAPGTSPVAGFAPEGVLGRKGLSRLTRTDQLASVACTLALDEPAVRSAGIGPGDTGIVLGTSVGSTRRVGEFIRDTFVEERPYFVNPSHFPGVLMNSAAGRAAIRLGLTGVNATVSGGPLAGLNALRYARNTLLAGHARRLLTGAFEELSPQRAWAWHRTRGLVAGARLGEGGAVFVLEAPRTGRPASDVPGEGPAPLARLLACEVGFADPDRGLTGVSERLAACLRTALERSGLTAGDVAVAAPGACGRRGWAAVEERALRQVFSRLPAGEQPHRLEVQPVLGETDGAAFALQLAALLARWQHGGPHTRRERAAVLTSVGPDGNVGCAVVVRPPE